MPVRNSVGTKVFRRVLRGGGHGRCLEGRNTPFRRVRPRRRAPHDGTVLMGPVPVGAVLFSLGCRHKNSKKGKGYQNRALSLLETRVFC